MMRTLAVSPMRRSARRRRLKAVIVRATKLSGPGGRDVLPDVRFEAGRRSCTSAMPCSC